MTNDRVPLIIDVDGTLLRSDLLWEGLAYLLTRRPSSLVSAAAQLVRGRAALKAFVARESEVSTSDLPLESHVLDLIHRARERGAQVVLASGAHDSLVHQVGERVGADQAWGTNGHRNLTRRIKLSLIKEHFDEFDYVGNSSADIPVWRTARRAMAINAGPITRWLAKRARPDLIVLPREQSPLRSWLRALRPHHWAKNALIFLPALAAHAPPDVRLWSRLLAGFFAFSIMASAVYLFNDVADLQNDRAHRQKRFRPVAAGEIAIPHALLAGVVLAVAASGLSLFLSSAFAVVLAAYLVITSAYSITLKQRLVIDVITLATLYTVRIVAGAALAEVPLSRWFLAFSIFLFLSLALVKRVVELLRSQEKQAEGGIKGRGYRPEDMPTLTAMGTAAAAASALVYCLYITGDDALVLYSKPDLLWIGLPLFLYWITRLWILATRGTLQEDPVAFALKDGITYLVVATFLLTVWVAG